jgi:DNA-binding response OmpR family regulator
MSTESPLKGKTILAVDDEPDVLATLEELLDMCQVVKKTNYDDAVEYLNSDSPDLAILDIMGVNGFELLKLCVSKKIDAVMLTAHAFSVESLKESLDLGARAYLPKEKMADKRTDRNRTIYRAGIKSVPKDAFYVWSCFSFSAMATKS